jgi:2,4-dienoyl-CoA reductase-like NADH-dependent reductase (Old Yellow Enzyme family)
MMDARLHSLFDPLVMPNMTLKNRFFMAPMGTGFPFDCLQDYLVARSAGGVGMITMADISVHPGGRPGIPNEPRLEADEDIAPLVPVVRAVQKAGAKIVAQLNHVGRYANSRTLGQPAVAPSAIASRFTGETPRALSTGEVEALVQAFVAAAVRAQSAGFDGIELCGCSGYLISQFLSPLTNRRTDRYGGSLSNRMRFLIDILSETRQAVGAVLNICVKFDAEDGMNGGKTLNDSKRMAPEIVRAGADRLHVWAGWHESSRPMLPMFVPRAAFVHLAQKIKRVVDVPVATVGRINDPYVAAEILNQGKADLIGLGRPLLCDPKFVDKILEGRIKEIRRCIGCCHCFDGMIRKLRDRDGEGLVCSLNPRLGREGSGPIRPAGKSKHVLIVGAGPAGMEAARIAALRGHRVDLYERADTLGGLLNIALMPPHKEELQNIIDYYSNRLGQLGVRFHFNSPVSLGTIRKAGPDITLLAMGASAVMPQIDGFDPDKVLLPDDALKGCTPYGKSVVVIGGGMIGIETAEYLADRGCLVTVIGKKKAIAPDMGATLRWGTILRMKKKMKIFVSEEVVGIESGIVRTRNKEGKEKYYAADVVVLAAGRQPDGSLAMKLTEANLPFVSIGSCRQPGDISSAILDGHHAGLKI